MTKKEALKILIKENPSTHEVAKALLALDDVKINVEDHTMIWTPPLNHSNIQVGIHRF